MKKILMAIHPEYVEQILSGKKKYEFRTKVGKQEVRSLVIYATAPVKRVVGEVEILEVLALSPEGLWNATKVNSGIAKDEFLDYYKDRDTAYAYHLGEAKIYDAPRELSDYGLKAAPQSFVYVEDSD